MACLSIRSFSSLEISLDDQPLAGIEYNKVRALLLLAMASERTQPRAMLCDLLWPDLPERSARNNLSQALTNLRKVIRSEGQPFLLTTNEAVQINPTSDISIQVDVCRFESLLEDSERHAHHSWHTCVRCIERLVTLVGPAGVGKTRLALSLAQALRFDYTNGALWVEMAPLADSEQVLPAIAQALNLTDETQNAIQAHLQNKHLLLVLDNFEHVIDAAPLIAKLLAHAPGLAVLVTSRMLCAFVPSNNMHWPH